MILLSWKLQPLDSLLIIPRLVWPHFLEHTVILLTGSNNKFRNYEFEFTCVKKIKLSCKTKVLFVGICYCFLSIAIWLVKKFVKIQDSYFWNWLLDPMISFTECISIFWYSISKFDWIWETTPLFLINQYLNIKNLTNFSC